MPPRSTNIKTEIADWLGVDRTTVYKWLKIPGFPVRPDGSVSPFEAGKWFVLREIAGEDDGDEDDGKSDDLIAWKIKNAKEDYRAKKLKNDATEASLIRVDEIAEKHNEMAHLIRTATEQLQREYGNDASQIITDALQELDRHLIKNNDSDTTEVDEE